MAVFTDGCPDLRSILIDAGITIPPILDWFHIAMRTQRATQTASCLPLDDLARMQASTIVVEEVEVIDMSVGLKVHRDAVDAIAAMGRRRTVIKHVSQMAAAVGTMNLGSDHSVAAIRGRFDRTLDRIIEARPSRAAFELQP